MSKVKLLGFEEYHVVVPDVYVLEYKRCSYYYMDNNSANYSYVPEEYMNAMGASISVGGLQGFPEHNEVLDTAKTVYIHSCCSFPKSYAAKKYKKTLNPWLADVVVVPNLTKKPLCMYENRYIFINEDKKLIAIIREPWTDTIKNRIVPGATISSIANSDMSYFINLRSQYKNYFDFDLMDMLDAKFESKLNLLKCDKKDNYIVDLIMGALPKNKLVYEDSFVASLNDDTNQITYDILKSIKEMLNSSDDEIVGTGMKALTTLNYMDYPNSVKYVLWYTTNKWYYNKARNSTAFKYLFKNLLHGNRYVRFQDRDISREDWDIFARMHREDNYDHLLPDYGFTYFDGNYQLQVRFKS